METTGFIHRFEKGRPDERPLLLLHGTGGDENDLIPLARMIAPTASLLSPRGKVLENGMPRFFRRLAEGVFDEDDVRRRPAVHDPPRLVLLDRLRQVRAAKGLSQEQLAHLAGLHRTHVSLIERSRRSVRLETLERLARALDIEPAKLLPSLRPPPNAGKPRSSSRQGKAR